MLVSPANDPTRKLIIYRIAGQSERRRTSIGVSAVEFPGPNGVTLRGQIWGGGSRCVVLVHDEGADLDSWREPSRWLAENGFRAFAVDMPGHGASDDPAELSAWPEAVGGALDFALAADAQALFAAGEGAGAAAVLALAARRADLRAAVLLSPEEDDRIARLDELREARLPKLILVGSEAAAARERAEIFFRGAIGPCELVQFPVAEQGAALFGGDWGDHAREKVLAHLLRFC